MSDDKAHPHPSTPRRCRTVMLAAGFGRRMRPLSDVTHKALLEVGGRSLLDGLVAQLANVGVDEVIVVTGYRATEVEGHLRRLHPSVCFTFVHNARSHDNVAVVDRYHSGLDGTVVSVDGDVVTAVYPSHRQHAGFDFSDKFKTLNIYRFAEAFVLGPLHRLLTYFARSIDANCFYEVIIGILIALQREPIHAVILEGERWAELDDPSDLAAARFEFEPASRSSILRMSHGGWWAHDIVDHCYLRNMHFPTGSICLSCGINCPRWSTAMAVPKRPCANSAASRPNNIDYPNSWRDAKSLKSSAGPCSSTRQG